MDSVCIPLVEDTTHASHQEVKVSSSSLREQKLAQLIRIPEVWLIAFNTIIAFVDLYKLMNGLTASLEMTVMSLRLC